MIKKESRQGGVRERTAPLCFFSTVDSPIGDIVIIWTTHAPLSSSIQRILLPHESSETEAGIREYCPYARKRKMMPFPGLKKVLRNFMKEHTDITDRGFFDFSWSTRFEKSVLRHVQKINPGHVISYGELARQTGNACASRAVGNTLRKNPFPLIFPCHRVIRSDRRIGGFHSGVHWKKKILAHEGVFFDESGRLVRGAFLN